MSSISGQYAKTSVIESGANTVSSAAMPGAVKGVEPLVTFDSVVVTISPEALKLQSLEEGYSSPKNGAETLPPTEDPGSDEGDALPGVISPLNGGGTLPPDPVKVRP